MIEGFRLSKVKNACCSITQMYDYIKIEFSIGMPYDLVFMVEVTPKDIDQLVVLLAKAEKELKERKELFEREKA